MQGRAVLLVRRHQQVLALLLLDQVLHDVLVPAQGRPVQAPGPVTLIEGVPEMRYCRQCFDSKKAYAQDLCWYWKCRNYTVP